MSVQIPQPQSVLSGLFPEIADLRFALDALEKKLEESVREREELHSRCQDFEEEINDLLEQPDTWLVCHLARLQSLKA